MNLPLFDGQPSARDFNKPNLRRAWKKFRAENPEVWKKLVRRSLQLRIRGVKRIGIATLFEAMRYDHILKTASDDDWKLNQNHRAYAARDLMFEIPGLEGLFEVRGVRS